jgi:acyl-CoA synthetase (AMP-forming)/AMP-acid ligase II
MVNLSAFIAYHARCTPERVAIVYEGERITYRDLHARILHTAGLLAGGEIGAGRGIGAGDVVAVFMKNSAAFLELAFAASHLGAVFLPVNFRLANDEVRYILENSGARILFYDEELAPVAGGLPHSVPVNVAAQRDSRHLGRAARLPALQPRSADDLFRLMYTSGTTDRPKGVMHTYDNFYWKCMEHVVALGLSAETRLLVAGPLYHVGAFDLPGVAVLWVGGMLCVHRQFDAAAVLASIEEERLGGAWLAPVMLSQILALPERGRYDVSSLAWVIGGGEKTPESRIREFGGYFTGGRYIDAYGLTESCSGDTFMEAGREIEKIGSTGRPTPHVAVEIRDDEGNSLPAGEDGEICLRGPKITRGYWKDPVKSAAAFFGDWFRTGDVGHLDAEGFLYITDRKKDMIISGGENIASSEVERVLYQLPEVLEAAVIGLPDERWGERPVAIVVPRPGARLDAERLQAHCRAQLAGFKVPRQVVFTDALPRNPSGKILKRRLREEFAHAAD